VANLAKITLRKNGEMGIGKAFRRSAGLRTWAEKRWAFLAREDKDLRVAHKLNGNQYC
jgi:hypothetical protein